MANGAAFEDALRLARETPSLDVGCHLVLIGGRSLSTGKPLPLTVPQLLAAMARREIRVYDELRAQVRRIVDAGIRPTHLDTHKHTHLAPPVLDAVARLGEEFDIPWVRRPFDFPLGLLRRRFHRVLEQPRPPRHGPLRRLPAHRPSPHRRPGGYAGRPSKRQHGIDVPPRPVRRCLAPRPHPLEREPRARVGRAGSPRSAPGAPTEWDRAGELRRTHCGCGAGWHPARRPAAAMNVLVNVVDRPAHPRDTGRHLSGRRPQAAGRMSYTPSLRRIVIMGHQLVNAD